MMIIQDAFGKKHLCNLDAMIAMPKAATAATDTRAWPLLSISGIIYKMIA